MNRTSLGDRLQHWRALAWPLLLGAGVGGVAAGVAQLETRWMVYLCAAVVLAVGFFLVPAKERALFAAFFLAFQVDVYLRPFYGAGGSVGLQLALVSFVAVALLAWCAATWPLQQRRTLILAGSLKWPILAMLGTTVLSFAVMDTDRFIGLDRVLFEFQLLAVYCVTLNVVRSEDDVQRVLRLLFITLAIQAAVYFVESALGVNFNLTGETAALGETPRPGGTVSANPAGFTSFIMPALMAGIAFYIVRQEALRLRALPLLVLAGAACVGLSFTRAAWIGLGLGLVLIGVVAAARGRLRTGRAVMIAAGAVAVMVALVPMLLMRLDKEYSGQSTLDERWNLILIALNVIAKNPLFGVGPGAYGDTFKHYMPAGLGSGWVYSVHNEFLLRAAETGIVGGLTLVVLIFAAYRCAIRVVRARSPLLSVLGIGWLGGLTAVVWQMIWVPWRGFSYNAMFWMFLGLMDACDRMRQRPPAAPAAGSEPEGEGVAGTPWRSTVVRRP